ncbi:hypothetical protein TOPH_00294 [Tolypocladium ophioglossoides CBS 100239]|uniref:Uncharacterized protein n=1 Tax=Tolypocladium ophioglossoides (strain CBS 100239) TaxID=1163406 RepID=A0A0L0NKP7_TOLOC|nr:hypothetical protein TOPH_00294 [Tolypocladium ophioglossoides CBS 100239]
MISAAGTTSAQSVQTMSCAPPTCGRALSAGRSSISNAPRNGTATRRSKTISNPQNPKGSSRGGVQDATRSCWTTQDPTTAGAART